METTGRISGYPGFWSKPFKLQLVYCIWVNLSSITIGLAFGFSTVTIAKIHSDIWLNEAPSKRELSIIANILTGAAPIGCIVCGLVTDRLGRRVMMIFCLFPMLAGWFCLGFARHTRVLIIGRFLTGIGVGMTSMAPRVYTTEITLPNMRALIGGLPGVAISIGMTLQALLGLVMYWRFLCLTSAFITLIIMFANCYLPETPYYVLLRKNLSDCREVLFKFRGKDYDARNEMLLMQDFKASNTIRRLAIPEASGALFKHGVCKPFWNIMIYLVFANLSGNSVFYFWTFDIWEISGAVRSPYYGNVLLSATRIGACIIVMILLFWFTIRSMALVATFAVGCTCLFLFAIAEAEIASPILPTAGIMTYVIFSSVSFYNLPLLVLLEILPLHIRGFLGGIVTALSHLLMFTTCGAYPLLKKYLGFDYTILLYGIFSFSGFLAVFFCFPETKGLNLQEIEEYYNTRRVTSIPKKKVQKLLHKQQLVQRIQTPQLSTLDKSPTELKTILKKKDKWTEQKHTSNLHTREQTRSEGGDDEEHGP